MTISHKGTPINLGGKNWILPPLNATALKIHGDDISKSVENTPAQHLALVSELTFLSLRRNYSEVTRDEVDEMVDMGNFMEVFVAMMKVSGLVYESGEAEGKPSR